MQATAKPRVLCVDDERDVLDGLELHLRKAFDVKVTTNPEEGLAMLTSQGPFAVVMSDMRMPKMNGATFLTQVRERTPDSTRILLTGHAELDAAISAINNGQVFRFLTKPCPAQQIVSVFQLASEQYRLITAEKELLEKTLRGSLSALSDVLALADPAAFGRATRVRQYSTDLATKVGITERWPIEVAAMVSQLGAIALPSDVAEKAMFGHPLSADEQAMVARVPQTTERLLGHIPRLEKVRDLLRRATTPTGSPAWKGASAQEARDAHVLKLALDFDALDTSGISSTMALDTLRGRSGYDAAILDTFASLHGKSSSTGRIKEVPVKGVRIGMVLAQEVRLVSGVLIAPRGYEIGPGFVERLNNFKPGTVKEPIRIVVRD